METKKENNKMNILFICRHNRFRSRFAELYLKKINKDKSIQAKSAGIFPGSWPLDKEEIKIAKKLGVNLKGKPKPVTTNLLKLADIIVLITNDIKDPENLFNYEKYKNKVLQWKIKDNEGDSEKVIENILTQIIKKIETTKWKQ
ncbi:MAG: hypothetical protein U9Q99_03325 [Nanoarchaeota archaeon]|nr:hypothetical protein [Nanoarchaeota archaeon]